MTIDFNNQDLSDVKAISDSTDTEQLEFAEVASAVNNFKLTNAATGTNPKLESVGTDTDVDLVLDAQGAGNIDLSSNRAVNVADPVDVQDAATKNYVDTQNPQSFLKNVVEDTTPQLGGDLDVNGNSIVSVSNGDILITPDGTGNLILDGLNWPTTDGTANQVIETDGAGNLSFVTAGGGETYVDINSTGTAASATGTDAIAIGEAAGAFGINSIRIGAQSNASAPGNDSIHIGRTTNTTNRNAKGDRNVIIGFEAYGGTSTLGADDCVIIGSYSNVFSQNGNNVNNVVIGAGGALNDGARVLGADYCISLGHRAVCDGDNEVAIGRSANPPTNGLEIRWNNASEIRGQSTGEVSLTGTNAQFVMPSYTVATLPTGQTGGMIFVTDTAGGAVPAFFDGTNWRRVDNSTVVA